MRCMRIRPPMHPALPRQLAPQSLIPLTLPCPYASIPKPPSTTQSTPRAQSPLASSEANAPARATSDSPGLSLSAPGEDEPIILDVSGSDSSSGAKLSHLGPLVVNVDGTLARITNWAQMTQPERDTAMRIIGKRNRERLAAVKRRAAVEEKGGSGDNLN